MVKLKCTVCNTRFGSGLCNQTCNKCNKGPCEIQCAFYNQCQLKDIPKEQYIEDLNEILTQKNITIPKKNWEYMNADYETVMYFFNNNFKGSHREKRTMHELLSRSPIPLFVGNNAELREPTEEVINFLKRLLDSEVGTDLVAFISTQTIVRYNGQLAYRIRGNRRETQIQYIKTRAFETVPIPTKDLEIYRDSADVDKAIYRMCCIGLIDDFTKDYSKNRCRIVAVRKQDGGYYKGLQAFLERYYSKDKAAEEIAKVPSYKGDNEVQKCLGYLTEFIYDKIAIKRKRAIDDMRTFCMIGLGDDWLTANEKLKDFIYYYFNSKYARKDYRTEEKGIPFSLTDDTDGGKICSYDILFKYLRVIDEDVIGYSSPKDNVKHLQGAVRLIRRSLTDANPALDLLNVFCLLYLKVGDNKHLQQELRESYINGYTEFYSRAQDKCEFYQKMKEYKEALVQNGRNAATETELKQLLEWDLESEVMIHTKWLATFMRNYTE